jgi:hypothetical protein
VPHKLKTGGFSAALSLFDLFKLFHEAKSTLQKNTDKQSGQRTAGSL